MTSATEDVGPAVTLSGGDGRPSDAPTPIAEVTYRERCAVRGTVHSMRVRPWADNPTLEVVLRDESGGISVVFLARRKIGGVRPGTVMTVEGVVGAHENRLAILNPTYVLESVPGHPGH